MRTTPPPVVPFLALLLVLAVGPAAAAAQAQAPAAPAAQLQATAPWPAAPAAGDSVTEYLPSAPKPPQAKCAAVARRANCAYYGVGRGQCEARGCCFDPDAAPFDPERAGGHAEPPPTFQHACFYPDDAVEIKKVHVVQANHFDAGYHDDVASQLQLYFDEYIPRAIRVGAELRAAGGEEGIRWMGQSWIFDLFLNCPPAAAGLRCPNATAVAAFKAAVGQRLITWHAFPHKWVVRHCLPSCLH
eukprot:SAG22_NODE_519_length_9510_cov_6.192222_10_plen_244_part_00